MCLWLVSIDDNGEEQTDPVDSRHTVAQAGLQDGDKLLVSVK